MKIPDSERKIRHLTVADLGEGPGPTIFLGQIEGCRAKKKYYSKRAPSYCRVWMNGAPTLFEGLDPLLHFGFHVFFLAIHK